MVLYLRTLLTGSCIATSREPESIRDDDECADVLSWQAVTTRGLVARFFVLESAVLRSVQFTRAA
jgi:hypothetical protein